MKAVGYRAESFSGSGVRKLNEILYFEVCQLLPTGVGSLRKLKNPQVPKPRKLIRIQSAYPSSAG